MTTIKKGWFLLGIILFWLSGVLMSLGILLLPWSYLPMALAAFGFVAGFMILDHSIGE